jgi:uncharacterized protein (DUF885 family)
VADDLEVRARTFVWESDPDLAVEVGWLPPVLWEDLSPAHRDEAVERADALLEELAGAGSAGVAGGQAPAGPGSAGVAGGARPFDVLRYHLTCARSAVAHREIDVLNHMTGPAARLAWAAESWPLVADPGAEVYVERLRAFPPYCRDVLRSSADWALPGSRPVLEAFVAQVDALVDAQRGEDPPLLRPIVAAGRTVPEEVLDNLIVGLLDLRARAVAAIPAGHGSSPLPHVPSGTDRYAEAVYRGTSRSMSGEQLEELGRAMLRRSQRRFEELLGGGRISLEPMASGGYYLDRAMQANERLSAALPAVCRDLPEMPCVVVPMPQAHAAVGPPAFYGPSSRRNGRPGSLFISTAEPVITREWEVLPLAMHEGVPGHHLQIALLDENESIPEVLRLLSVNAFTEGWAVYAERLAGELGLDVGPVDEFGLIAHQRWRAARLVTDVGLHLRGWGVDEAVRFMAANTAQDERAVRREVIRYLAWPGQALGYAVGAETIAGWVAARRAEGTALPDAHADLLRLGSVPLSALTGD